MKIYQQITLGLALVALASVARGADVVSIWGGARGAIILKSDGTVWTWGDNFTANSASARRTTLLTTVPVEVHGAGNVSYLNSVKRRHGRRGT